MTAPDVSHSNTLPEPPVKLDTNVLALFVDVDGTLVDFASRPNLVCVPSDLPNLLRRLNRLFGGAFALLSGRSLGDLEAMLGNTTDLNIGALHGLVRQQARNGLVAIPPGRAIERLRTSIEQLVAGLPGLILEDKGATIALHYRAHPELALATIAAAEALVTGESANLHLLYGDHVVEFRPIGADKGTALAAFMADPPFRGRQPLMLGDDHTDEDAFTAAGRLNGDGIIVGARRPTRARYCLPDPGAVRAWLRKLLDTSELEKPLR